VGYGLQSFKMCHSGAGTLLLPLSDIACLTKKDGEEKSETLFFAVASTSGRVVQYQVRFGLSSCAPLTHKSIRRRIRSNNSRNSRFSLNESSSEKSTLEDFKEFRDPYILPLTSHSAQSRGNISTGARKYIRFL
jgi:hypothetical protein